MNSFQMKRFLCAAVFLTHFASVTSATVEVVRKGEGQEKVTKTVTAKSASVTMHRQVSNTHQDVYTVQVDNHAEFVASQK